MWPMVSAQSLAWMLFRSERTESEQELKHIVFGAFHEISVAWKLSDRFLKLFDRGQRSTLTEWLEQATHESAPAEFKRFALGLKRDFAAVEAAIDLPWSNGQTEGQVNRLKTIKRQMYGRGSFELLRIRFLISV